MQDQSGPKYYIVPVFESLEPSLLGPYATQEEQGQQAKATRAGQDEDDALFWLDVAADGTPTIGAYAGWFFEEGGAASRDVGEEDRDEVEIGTCVMRWDSTDGAIRAVDEHGNIEDIWRPDHADYASVKADYFPNKVVPEFIPFRVYCERNQTDVDKAGHRWTDIYSVCSICGQPDDFNDGMCNHAPLTDEEVQWILDE